MANYTLDKITAQIEALRVEESNIWLSLDPQELASQIAGKPLSEETAQKVAKAKELQRKVFSLIEALATVTAAEARKRDQAEPRKILPLH